MENIKREVVEVLTRKAGLDTESAQRAVDAVIEHFRQNPGRITELLGLGSLFGGGGGGERRESPPPRDHNRDVI